ncbi:MAG: hypothetical protein PWQ37_714 [Candidatus Petromonas sp.]|jgi:radical SAM superfamily enzyme YgiQ (UPF0313 family)|nr:hypothetical protein [Candidatus Petromonas sp.]
MRYEGTVYRPPSEARSLIIQTTIGCSHNKCTFCSMYKDKQFRIRNINEIIKDLEEARKYYNKIERIFLADGNALALKTEKLKIILKTIKKLFPECKRVGIYAAPKDILRKSVEELKELKEIGLGIAYLGVESGSDYILKKIKKGITANEMIRAGKRIIDSGIKLSVTLISGLGGKDNWMEHAQESARVINEINPHYLGLLTLLLEENTEMHKEVQSGELRLLSPKEVMMETRELVKNLELTNCIFRSNHASNYLMLGGTLPKDKKQILKEIDGAMNEEYDYRDESFRRL